MHYDLAQLARRAMKEAGLEPDYPQAALDELSHIDKPAPSSSSIEDLRGFLWCSIDNDDSRDLDQLTFAAEQAEGSIALWVAIADVDALIAKDSPIDLHAQVNTTTVYTPTIIFPMLPEKLSTNLTSLNEHQDRVAIVVRILIDPTGQCKESSIHHALVYNHAKLAYRSVGNWLETGENVPQKVASKLGLSTCLHLQSKAAQILRKKRFEEGALSLETIEARPKMRQDQVVGMEPERKNLAHQLIEEFMIAANSAIALYLSQANRPSIRRVVRVPKRWDRIVEVAQEAGYELSPVPDSRLLDAFLSLMRRKDPEAFPDLSLTIIKLLGSGEYIVERPQDETVGHFCLALKAYTHSTAPNRRYPDVITQRQVKSVFYRAEPKYQLGELDDLARHCTLQEDVAAKVERRLNKSAAALLLLSHIGEHFDGIVTGAAEKGTWVRIFHPAVEGKIVAGREHLDVGHRVRVKLVSVDVAQGFIDFTRQK